MCVYEVGSSCQYVYLDDDPTGERTVINDELYRLYQIDLYDGRV